ncbi:haloacid dehalogenase-like hydrolase [Bifidobacterium biavatii DSM 23969]|uniref:Haloacid dehalogenase-like hydrolase n=2 Tax=Bifidobacterium biavatii TaxID=762212 RepID=A0A086ZND4_9BIFI|nr:haloacid dehalogenase-like hydrolase [Bifidobacterium biavatii DSM 23969]
MRYDAVFFDLYGTLIDIRTDESSDAAWDALRDALAGYGVAYDDDCGDGRYGGCDDGCDDGRVDDCTDCADRNAGLRARFDAAARPIVDAARAERGEWAEPDLLPAYAALLDGGDLDDGHGDGRGDDGRDGANDRAAAARALAWAFRQGSTSLLRLYPGALEFLQTLHEAGLRVVLVSNAQTCYTRPELERLGLDAALDRIVISSDEGVRKPGAEIFRRALAYEGLDADRVLMVGNDSRCDIGGARSAGIDGAYLRTEISPADDPAVCESAVLSLAGADYAGILRFLNL